MDLREGATVDLREGATVDMREGATVDMREGATVDLRRRCYRGPDRRQRVHEEDTETVPSFDGCFIVSGEEEVETLSPVLEVHEPVRIAIREAFPYLDDLNLEFEFRRRACVMKTIPVFLKGPFRCALKTAVDEICCGIDADDAVRQTRGWKLLMLLLRMLLHRPPRGELISEAKLAGRFDDFSHGRWHKLVEAGRRCAEDAATAVSRKRRRTSKQPDIERRAVRAQSLVELGELSSGRQALVGADVAPGSIRTRQELSNPQRRPPFPREPLPAELINFQPANTFELDERRFSQNLRSFRRGAAAGPSGMTAEHLQPVLEAVRVLHSLFRAAESLAAAQVPTEVVNGLRLGRITALLKPTGGVRGIVAGDIIRRLVGRTMAQQLGLAVERATSPYQYALSTRAGCECVAHALHALCETDPQSTILCCRGCEKSTQRHCRS